MQASHANTARQPTMPTPSPTQTRQKQMLRAVWYVDAMSRHPGQRD